MPCFLGCYLLVVPAEMGPGSGDLSSSQGLLDKEPNIPLCARVDTGSERQGGMSEYLSTTISPSCRYPWAGYIEEETF